MTEKKAKRKYTRKHLNWRLDYDYWRSLSEEEKEWLDKFNDEYYRNAFNNLPPIHHLEAPCEYSVKNDKKVKGTVKQQLMYEEFTRRRDVVYADIIEFEKRRSTYSPESYISRAEILPGDPGGLEDALLEFFDKKYAKVFKKHSDKKRNKRK